MSKSATQSFTCPKCGRMQECKVVEVLEPGEAELEQLFRGKLNYQKCPQCGTDFLAESALVYKETESPFLLFLEQYPEDNDVERVEREADNLAVDISNAQNSEKPQLRLVFSRPEFLEKIALRQRGLDDRIIEYAKLQLYRNTDESTLSRSEHRLLYDYTNSNDENMFFLVYDRSTSKPVNTIQVAMEEFHTVEQALQDNEDAMAELIAAFPGCYVSADRLL